MNDLLKHPASTKTDELLDVLSKNVNGTHPSLLGGNLGVYLPLILSRREEYTGIFNDQIEEVISKALEVKEPSYCNGLTGTGMFLELLRQKDIFDTDDIAELLAQIDEVAYHSGRNYLKVNNHDFLHGAVGCMIYLTERAVSNPKAEDYIKELLSALEGVSRTNEHGIYWVDNPTVFNKDWGDNILNLSLSHGLAGKIVLFSKLIRRGIHAEQAGKLLRTSVNFLLNCKNKDGSVSVYPGFLSDAPREEYARLAWCYGDLGIAVSLWQAGIAMNDENIKTEAVKTCMATTGRRDMGNTGIHDAGLCHGSAGVAQIYKKMYAVTGINGFKEAWEYWHERTLQMTVFPDGLAGYKTFSGTGTDGWHNETALLEGIAGITLYFLQDNDVADWDKLLLITDI